MQGLSVGLAVLTCFYSYGQAARYQCYECRTDFDGTNNTQCLDPAGTYDPSSPTFNASLLVVTLCPDGYVCGKYSIYQQTRARMLIRGCFRSFHICPVRPCFDNAVVGVFTINGENVTAAIDLFGMSAVSCVCLCDSDLCNDESGFVVTEGNLSALRAVVERISVLLLFFASICPILRLLLL